MRILPLLSSLMAIATPLHSLQAEGTWQLLRTTERPTQAPRATSTTSAIRHWEKQARKGENGRPVRLQLIMLDRSRTTLRVLDLPERTSVADGVSAAGAWAGVNGGYFQPNHSPLGLVVSDGVRLHPFQKAKILSGLLIVTPKGAQLLRNAEYKGGANIRQALQAGPFLIDHAKPVTGLNANRADERTVVLADQKGVAALLISEHITLADLAQLLATPALFPELKIERALNLDGGSSTALWVNATPPFSHPEWKQVRNVLAVMPNSNSLSR